jgi:hypothetical protein
MPLKLVLAPPWINGGRALARLDLGREWRARGSDAGDASRARIQEFVQLVVPRAHRPGPTRDEQEAGHEEARPTVQESKTLLAALLMTGVRLERRITA